MKKCPDCETEMEKKHTFKVDEPIFGVTYTVKSIYQCPKCKRIDIK